MSIKQKEHNVTIELTSKQKAKYEKEVNDYLSKLASRYGMCGKIGHADDCKCDYEQE